MILQDWYTAIIGVTKCKEHTGEQWQVSKVNLEFLNEKWMGSASIGT